MLGLSFTTRLPLDIHTASSSKDTWQQFLDSLGRLPDDPTALTIRIGLSFAVLVIALLGGRWLAGLAGRAPLHLEGTLARAGRFRRRRSKEAQTSIGPWLGRLTTISIWIAALLALAAIWFSAVSAQPVLEPKDLSKFVIEFAAHVGGSLLVFAATLGIGRLFQRSLEKSLQHRVNRNLALLAGRVLYLGVLAIGFIIILTIWDTGIVVPVTLIGALTVALTLALQDVLKNLVSGVYLLVERPFTIGDRISLTPYTGVIEDIEIRYTSLRTLEGQRVIIPNSLLFGSPVVNLSAYQQQRASFTVTIPDPGGDAIGKAEQSIRAALASAPGVLPEPVPEVDLTRVAAGTADLRVAYWQPTASAETQATVISHLLGQLRSEGVGVEISAHDTAAT